MLHVIDSESQTCKTITIRPVLDHIGLRAWMNRMGFPYEDAAEKLGVHRSTFAAMLNGVSRETGRPLPLARTVQLAAMAIELGLDSVLPPPQVRSKKRRTSGLPADQVARINADTHAALESAIAAHA